MSGRGRGRGGGVALPGLGGGPKKTAGGRGTGISLRKEKGAPPPAPAPAKAAGRGGGIAAPKISPRPNKGAPPPVPGGAKPAAAPVAQPSVAASSGKMPRKFKVPEAPPMTRQAKMEEAKGFKSKVKRQHIPKWDKRKWNAAQSLFYPYDKIKNDFELEGLFTRQKDKAWMVIYFDMVLMYLPTKEGPPAMDDKLEGRPFDYFFLDNVVDSDKIKMDEGKLVIQLPTKHPKDDLKIVCDTKQQFQEWATTLRELCKMFETLPRDGIETREIVERNLTTVQKDVPLGVEVVSDNVDHVKAGDWLLEMRRMSDLIRKHQHFVDRLERFSQYRVGHINVYCNFYQGRDRDGPSEMMTKAKKKVLGFWESEVERFIKLCEEVLSEDAILKDHLPFHMEDCQIGAFYIDCINSYSIIVHGVQPSKVVLQKSLVTLEDLYVRLSQAKIKDESSS